MSLATLHQDNLCVIILRIISNKLAKRILPFSTESVYTIHEPHLIRFGGSSGICVIHNWTHLAGCTIHSVHFSETPFWRVFKGRRHWRLVGHACPASELDMSRTRSWRALAIHPTMSLQRQAEILFRPQAQLSILLVSRYSSTGR